MSLDLNACLKAFSIAFCQYCSHPNEQTLKDVERQMDVLIGITSTGKSFKGFLVKELLPTECLTSLVSMLTEKNNKIILTSKCISLLHSLAKDDETRVVLRDTYHLASTIAGLLLYHRSKPSQNEKIIYQCLELLQRITYDYKPRGVMGYIEELVKFLINQIQSSESELTLSSLGVLANLCRNNIAVQAQIKALGNIKYIYRTLIRFLSHNNLTVIVYALSLLTSLALQEQLGEKLFNAKNVNQTFQLLFNILINGEGIFARKYSVDLFVDLLCSERIRQSLLKYDHLPFYLEQVIKLLSSCESDEAAKIFEFLFAFCGVSDLRSTLLTVFLSRRQETSSPSSKKESPSNRDAFGCISYWLNKSNGNNYLVSIKALRFIKEVYEEIISNGIPSDFYTQIKSILPTLVKNLKPPENVEGSNRKFEKIACALDVLLVLTMEENVAKIVVEHVPVEICRNLVEQQYRLNDVAMKEKLSFTADWSDIGVVVCLKTLHLMDFLRLLSRKMQETMTELLQDYNLVSFLAHTMVSDTKERVHTALTVLREACKNPKFQVAGLGELLYGNNHSKEEELRTLRRRQDDVMASPISDSILDPSLSVVLKDPSRGSYGKRQSNPKTSTFINSLHDESTIESLIDKIKTGMEIKDPKASEIMDVYEAKLASLQTKEGHLQDLLEAKTLALLQSDRMISQYRCRRAQSEAECAKLRHMLQETEKRCEAQVEKIRDFLESGKVLNHQIEQIQLQNRNLQMVVGEHEQLKITFTEQGQRVETLKKALVAAQEEHKSLSELNEMLRRHNDNLKNQHDCATRQLQELEDERKKVMQQVKQKDTKLCELSKTLEQRVQESKEKDQEIANFSKSLEKTKVELQKSEQGRKELTHKVTSLEMICSQREETVKEKEKFLKEQQAQLDKYAQMSAMIHSLTGGKVTITKD